MALIFIDGFDHYAQADIASKWDGFSQVTSAGTSATPTIVAGRYGGSGWRFKGVRNGTTAFDCYVSKSLGGNKRTILLGFAIKIEAPVLAYGFRLVQTLDAGTAQVEVILNSDATLSIARNGTVLGTTASALTLDTWNYVVFKLVIGDATGVSGTYGEYHVWFNGASVLSATNVDTKNTANAYAQTLRVGQIGIGSSPNSASGTFITIDDLWIDDATNHGEQRVQTLRPSAAGNAAEWTPSAGTNRECVDDATLDTADFVESTTVNQKDTHVYGDVAASATPTAVAVTVMALSNDGGGAIRPLARVGATDYDSGADLALTGSVRANQGVFANNPATAAPWTPAEINAAEFGYKKVA